MRTIWLASYPKSGNTWLRMLIAGLSVPEGGTLDINGLPQRESIASARGPFDHLTLLDSSLLSHDEIDALRPTVHRMLARGARDDVYDTGETARCLRFVKSHDGYTYAAPGVPLLAGAEGADGAVLIVRDPRDVVPSLANHRGTSLDETIDFMNDETATFCGRVDRLTSQLRQRLLGWSGFAASWLEQRDVPVHLVRYEDLAADTAGCLAAILAFAEYPATDKQIRRAIGLASFEQLTAQERAVGFREAPRPRCEAYFFRRGEVGAWRSELTSTQVARIEAAHAPMMKRFGYRLAEPADLAQATGDRVCW